MKQLLLIATFLVVGIVKAQETPKYVFAQIIGETRMMSNKITVSIDYGQHVSFFDANKVKNEDGSNRKFNSMVDAMNYMGALGWEFKQAYILSGSMGLVYYWIIQKPFSELDMSIQEEMKKNFPTKKDLQ